MVQNQPQHHVVKNQLNHPQLIRTISRPEGDMIHAILCIRININEGDLCRLITDLLYLSLHSFLERIRFPSSCKNSKQISLWQQQQQPYIMLPRKDCFLGNARGLRPLTSLKLCSSINLAKLQPDRSWTVRLL